MAEEKAAKASAGIVQRSAPGVASDGARIAATIKGGVTRAPNYERLIRSVAAGAAHGHDIDPDLVAVFPGLLARDAGGAPAVSRPDGLRVRSVRLRAVREAEREADWVASTEGEAADGAILRQDWRLERFLKNPVVLFAHDICSLPIGRAKNIRIEDGQLRLTVKFATANANPFAELCWQSVLEDMLRGGSVGFLPGRIEREDVGGVLRTVLYENELYEFTICPVPSDADSLVDRMERSIAGWPGGVARVHAPKPITTNVTAPPVEAQQPAAAGGQEDPMDEKLKEALAAKERELAEATKALTDEKAKSETLRAAAEKAQREADEARAAAAKAEKDTEDEKAKTAAEKERADGLQKKLCGLELEPLVGRQISPEERDELIEIALENPKRYGRMVNSAKARPATASLTDPVDLGGAGLPDTSGAEQSQGGALIGIFNRQLDSGTQLRAGEFISSGVEGATGPVAQPSSDGLNSLLQRHAGAA
jgi:HK97 family phage prohead protease